MFRKFAGSFLVALVAVALASCQEEVSAPAFEQPQFGVGNELPTGAHFTLNLIGVKDKTAAMKAANEQNGIGGRIFVALWYDDGDNTGECWEGACPIDSDVTVRKNKILLIPGDPPNDNFAVLDANATDSDGALFRLPRNVSATYQVFARPLGKPGRSATLTTCATYLVDPDPLVTGDEYEEVLCSLNQYVAMRETGKPRTDDVTADLLFIQVDIDAASTDPTMQCLAAEYGDGMEDVPLFDPCFEQFFWDYDNNGLKLLQLRFHPLTTP